MAEGGGLLNAASASRPFSFSPQIVESNRVRAVRKLASLGWKLLVLARHRDRFGDSHLTGRRRLRKPSIRGAALPLADSGPTAMNVRLSPTAARHVLRPTDSRPRRSLQPAACLMSIPAIHRQAETEAACSTLGRPKPTTASAPERCAI